MASSVFPAGTIRPNWFQRMWDRYILPALIAYGLSKHGRYSDAFVVWGRDYDNLRR